jgi:hypothetical protein
VEDSCEHGNEHSVLSSCTTGCFSKMAQLHEVTVVELSNEIPILMGMESSLQCSQNPVTEP